MIRGATLSLAVAAVAFAGCRKSPTGNSTSFPAPGAVNMKAGDFITTAGIFESTDNPRLPDQFVDFRISISPRGKDMEMQFHYETRRSVGDSAVYVDGYEAGPVVNAASGWFCFVEKPGIYWVFNGRKSLRVDSHGPLGGPSKSIIRGTFVNRDNPKVPEAVLARLPEQQRDLLSPPSGEHPAY